MRSDASARLLDQLAVGHLVDTPSGEQLQVARGRGGLGVWSETERRWLFGGSELTARSLLACRHFVAARMGVFGYLSLTVCPGCGAWADTELLSGFDDYPERYEVDCPVCGQRSEFHLDCRRPQALPVDEAIDLGLLMAQTEQQAEDAYFGAPAP